MFSKVVFAAESMKNPFPETLKIAVSVSFAVEHFEFVVTAFGKAVGVGNIK